MQLLLNRFFSRDLGWRIGGIVFFAIFYVYLWMGVKPQLIYHGGGEFTDFPFFYKGWAFAGDTVLHPGGPVEYLSAFLSQLLYLPWAGALVLTVHALLICVFTACFLKTIGISRFRTLSFLPAVLLLITYNRYTYHFTTTLALLAALIFSCIYVKAAPKSKILTVLLFFLLCVVLYLIAAGEYLFFALVCGVYEIFFRRRLLIGLSYFLLVFATGLALGVLFFRIAPIDVYSDLLPFSKKIIDFPERRRMIWSIYAIYLWLPIITAADGLWYFLTGKKPLLPDKSSYSKPEAVRENYKYKKVKEDIYPKLRFLKQSGRSGFIFHFETTAIVAIAVASFYFSLDYKRKTLFEIDYYAYNRDWKKVFETARRYPNSYYMNHFLNRALYHLGRLPYDMFSYRQHPWSLFLTSNREVLRYWRVFDINYELGLINYSESGLLKSLELFGEQPFILKRLAMVRMAKGDIGTSRVYLGALSKTLFHSKWAKDYLRRIESDPNLLKDEEIQSLCRFMLEKDVVSSEHPMEKRLSDLLEKNRTNKMAFEYLMVWYMLNKQLDRFIANLHRLDDFDYPYIPRHFEEAILTYNLVMKKETDLHGRRISQQSQERFKSFIQLAETFGSREAAFNDLAKNYGDTYYFYYIYKVSELKDE